MKPDTATAMQQIIEQARAAIPFYHPVEEFCGKDCRGCSIKLLEYLDSELANWESKLQQGIRPNLGEVDKLAKACNRIYTVLQKNGLIQTTV